MDFSPDLLILVDYPGFNLRMAKFAKENSVKTYYYISPKIWAWKKSRAWKIKKYIDKMFVIFPFEKDFYKTYDYKVEYVGNPLIDEIEKKKENLSDKESFFKTNNLLEKPIIAVLAGSRKQEIKYILPEILQVTNNFPDYQFILAGAPGLTLETYTTYISDYPIKVIFNQTYDILKHAHASVVTSGTATLEAALFNVPQTVVYKMNMPTYEIGKFFIRIKFFSLVNIIMQKAIVQELLQKKLPDKIQKELSRLLSDKEYRNLMLANYNKLKEIMGQTGASKRTAEVIYSDLL
ncbi:MAG: lipid-A-disaccharide synthase [Bacteroidetes bacterium]|nr:MAG: lipid-A-disaccharide synthase [Bacteroidota bacterium]